MKVLFVYSLEDYQTVTMPLKFQQDIQFGLSYISALLKSKGHETDALVLTRETEKCFINRFISKFNPHLICFTAVATEYNYIRETANYIKKKFPSIYLLIGGPHATLNPEKVIDGPFDALCVGEGEYPTLELSEQLKNPGKPTTIKNLWIKNTNKIEKNPTREFLQELDVLPFPDIEIWQKWINFTDTG